MLAQYAFSDFIELNSTKLQITSLTVENNAGDRLIFRATFNKEATVSYVRKEMMEMEAFLTDDNGPDSLFGKSINLEEAAKQFLATKAYLFRTTKKLSVNDMTDEDSQRLIFETEKVFLQKKWERFQAYMSDAPVNGIRHGIYEFAMIFVEKGEDPDMAEPMSNLDDVPLIGQDHYSNILQVYENLEELRLN